MKKIILKITRRLSHFDISPVNSGGISKLFIFLIWGLNAIFFIGAESSEICKCFVHSPNHSTVCTIIKKISKAELFCETTFFINTKEFVIISSYDIKIPHYEVIIKPKSRAPPSFLHS